MTKAAAAFKLEFTDGSTVIFQKDSDGDLMICTKRPSAGEKSNTATEAARYIRRIYSSGQTPEDGRQLDAITAALGCLTA